VKRGISIGLIVLLLAAAGLLLFIEPTPRIVGRGARALTDGGEADSSSAAGESGPASELAATRVVEDAQGAAAEESLDDATAWPPMKAVRLHVVDAERRFELQHCEVREAAGFPSSLAANLAEPGDANAFARGDSPLDLQPGRSYSSLQTVVVRAEGYAPSSASIDWNAGGDQEIALRTGSTLELVLRGRPDQTSAKISLHRLDTLRRWMERRQESLRDWGDLQPKRLRSELSRLEHAAALLAGPIALGEIGDPALLVALRAGPPQREVAMNARFLQDDVELPGEEVVTIEGLEAGTWCVVVEHGRFMPEAAGAIEIEAPRHRLELPWRVREPPRRVEVTGRLIVDPAWFRDSPRERWTFDLGWAGDPFSIDQRDRLGWTEVTARAVADAPSGTYEFSFERVPGPWLARLDEVRAVIPIDVPSEGAHDLLLRVAPPAEVALTFVDGTSGKEARGVGVHWQPGAAREVFRVQGMRPELHADGRCQFLAPVGELDLWIISDGYGAVSRSIELLPGRNERRIELLPVAQLEAVLKEGDRSMPWTADHQLVILREGERRMSLTMRMSESDPVATFTFDVSGRWFVVLRDLDGYAPVEPIPVDLIAGQTAKIEIPLKKVRRGGP
jgi:hypothetical protein